jgi:hypothetical protein
VNNMARDEPRRADRSLGTAVILLNTRYVVIRRYNSEEFSANSL